MEKFKSRLVKKIELNFQVDWSMIISMSIDELIGKDDILTLKISFRKKEKFSKDSKIGRSALQVSGPCLPGRLLILHLSYMQSN